MGQADRDHPGNRSGRAGSGGGIGSGRGSSGGGGYMDSRDDPHDAWGKRDTIDGYNDSRDDPHRPWGKQKHGEKDDRGSFDRIKGGIFATLGDKEEKRIQEKHNQWSKNKHDSLVASQNVHGETVPNSLQSQINDFTGANTQETLNDVIAAFVGLVGSPMSATATGLLSNTYSKRGQGEDESDAAYAGRSYSASEGADGLTSAGLSAASAFTGVDTRGFGMVADAKAKSGDLQSNRATHDPHSSGNGPKDRTSSVSVSSAPQMTIEDVIKLFAGFTQEPVEEESKPFEFANLDLSRLGGRK